jgi:hypothetical protein
LLACARPLAVPVVEVPDPSASLVPDPAASLDGTGPLPASVEMLATDVVDVYAVEGAAIGVWREGGRYVLARLRDDGAPDPSELTATLPQALRLRDERCPALHGIVGRWPDTLWLGFQDGGCEESSGPTQFLRFHEGHWRWAGLRSPDRMQPVWFALPEWQHGVGAVFGWTMPGVPPAPAWVIEDFFPAAQETPTLHALSVVVGPEPGASLWISPRKHQLHVVGSVDGIARRDFGLQIGKAVAPDEPEWIAPPLGGTDDVRVAGVRGQPGRLVRFGKGRWAELEGWAPSPIFALRGDPDARLWAIAGEERALWVRAGARWTPLRWDRGLAAGALRPLYFVSADAGSAVVVAESPQGTRAVLRVVP